MATLPNTAAELATMLRQVADSIEGGNWGSLASLRTIAHLVDVPYFVDLQPTGILSKEQVGATLILSTLPDPRPLIARDWFTAQAKRGIGPGDSDLYGDFHFGSRH